MGYGEIPKHVEVFGVANAEQRKQLMKKAKALFGLTYYVEPFGNMIIEAALSGTPVISTDWGAFPEIVIQGQTGYRCRNFKQILTAIEDIENGKIDTLNCKNHGCTFSDELIHEQHREYINKLVTHDFYAE